MSDITTKKQRSPIRMSDGLYHFYDDDSNEQILGELFPTLDIRGLSRRELKKEAFRVAGNENIDNGLTYFDVIPGNYLLNAKFKRQANRFDRLVRRQYERNREHTLQNERIKAAKNGNVEALQDYIRSGRDRVAPYLSPAVLGPAAAAVAGSGAVGTATGAVLKGLANPWVRWPLEAFGVLDLGYRASTGKFGNDAIERLKEGDYWAAAGNGLLDLVDIVGTVTGVAEGVNALKSSKNLKRLLTANSKYHKLKAEQKALSDIQRNSDQQQIAARLGINTASYPTLDAAYETTNVTKNGVDVVTDAVPYKLPDGTTIMIDTKTGSIYNGEFEIPEMTDLKSIIARPVATFDNNLMYRRIGSNNDFPQPIYAGPDGIPISGTNINNIPLQATQNKDFVKYLHDAQNTMGNSGVVGGSSLLYEKGYISGVPNDLEVITTKNRKKELMSKIGFDQTNVKHEPMADSSVSKVAGGSGATDIQTIDEDADGFAVGKLAHEIYRILYPTKHADYLSKQTIQNGASMISSSTLKLPKSGGGFYTADELLDEFMQAGGSYKKSLVDALSVGKMDYTGSKLMRPVGILSNTDPALQDDVLDAIHTIGEMNMGKDFKTVDDLYPDIDYSDVAANEKFLEYLGFDKSLANDPKAMKNITEYYHMQMSSSNRVYYDVKNDSDVVDFANIMQSYKGGTSSGAGGNSILGTGTAFNYPYRNMAQYPISKNSANIKTPFDMIQTITNQSHDAKVIDTYGAGVADELRKLGLRVDDSTTIEVLDRQLAIINDGNITKKVGEILDINGIYGKPYNHGHIDYYGRYNNEPSASSYRVVINTQYGEPQVEYELGRLLHKYKTYGSDIKLQNDPKLVEDFRKNIMQTFDDFLSGKISSKEGFIFNKNDWDKIKQLQKEYTEAEEKLNKATHDINNVNKAVRYYAKIADKLDNIILKGVQGTTLGGLGVGVGALFGELFDHYQYDKDHEKYGPDYYKEGFDKFEEFNGINLYDDYDKRDRKKHRKQLTNDRKRKRQYFEMKRREESAEDNVMKHGGYLTKYGIKVNKFGEDGGMDTSGGAENNINPQSTNPQKDGPFSSKNLGSTIGAIGGSVMTLTDNAMKNAEVNTTEADNALEATKNHQLDTSSLDALANSYNSAPWLVEDYDFKDFRPGGGELAMNTLSSVVSGVSTGATAGGGWGAFAGAIVGGATAAGGMFAGRAKAKKELDRITNESKLANMSIAAQGQAAADNLIKQQANQKLMNVAAYGGSLGNFSGDFSNDVMFINAGGTHEQNPLEGVPMGFDREGTPNLVEEGEVIYNDYVFSNRLKANKKGLENVGFTDKYKDWTFSKIAEDIQKESAERPNDILSKNTLDDMMNRLIQLQEEVRIKKEKTKQNKFNLGGKVNKFHLGEDDMTNPDDTTKKESDLAYTLYDSNKELSPEQLDMLLSLVPRYIPSFFADENDDPFYQTDYISRYENIQKGNQIDYPIMDPQPFHSKYSTTQNDDFHKSVMAEKLEKAKKDPKDPENKDFDWSKFGNDLLRIGSPIAANIGALAQNLAKPDYRQNERAVNEARTAPMSNITSDTENIDVRPIDVNYMTNMLRNQGNATLRNINNTAINRQEALANYMIANNQLREQMADSYFKASEANLNRMLQEKEFNRGNDQFETHVDLQNFANNAARYKDIINAVNQAAIADSALDSARAEGLYAAESNLAESLSGVGSENHWAKIIDEHPALLYTMLGEYKSPKKANGGKLLTRNKRRK